MNNPWNFLLPSEGPEQDYDVWSLDGASDLKRMIDTAEQQSNKLVAIGEAECSCVAIVPERVAPQLLRWLNSKPHPLEALSYKGDTLPTDVAEIRAANEASPQELLQLAASAVGHEFGWIHDGPRIKVEEGWTPWNPLDRNNDALELAAALDISMSLDEAIEISFDGTFGEYEKGVETWVVVLNDKGTVLKNQVLYGDDKLKAIRRAITLTAAGIQRHRAS